MSKSFHIFHTIVSIIVQGYAYVINYLSPNGLVFVFIISFALLYQMGFPWYQKRRYGDKPYLMFTPIPVRLDGVWSLSYYVVDSMKMISKEELFRKRLSNEPVTMMDHHREIMAKYT